jgi:DNA-binding transcriptional MerR regulator
LGLFSLPELRAKAILEKRKLDLVYHPVEIKGDFSLHEVSLSLPISRTILLNYEKLGLIPPAEVKESGYRHYSPEVVARLPSIERLKESGLSLKDIRLFLEGRLGTEGRIEELESKQRTIQGKWRKRFCLSFP